MDQSDTLLLILGLVIPILFFIFLIIVISRPSKHTYKSKGEIGEKYVEEELSKLLKEDEYIIGNLLIPFHKGSNEETEIDTVMITHKGLFVIEVKTRFGLFKGNIDDDHWTQYAGNDENTMYNPIKQNNTHIKAIANVCPYIKDIYNIIIFADDAEYVGDAKNIYDINSFKEYYLSLESKILYNTAQLSNLNKRLSNFIATEEQLKAHRERLNNKYNNG